MYTIDKKLVEEGKIEILKDLLNDFEFAAKSDENCPTLDSIVGIRDTYNLMKSIGPDVDTKEYDKRLEEIIKESGNEEYFHK
jgi:hypothetical protein